MQCPLQAETCIYKNSITHNPNHVARVKHRNLPFVYLYLCYLLPYLHTYLITYLPINLHTYLCTYIHTHLLTYLCTSLPTSLLYYLFTSLPTYLPTDLLTYICTSLPTSLLCYLFTSLPTHLHIYLIKILKFETDLYVFMSCSVMVHIPLGKSFSIPKVMRVPPMDSQRQNPS